MVVVKREKKKGELYVVPIKAARELKKKKESSQNTTTTNPSILRPPFGNQTSRIGTKGIDIDKTPSHHRRSARVS